MKKKCHPSCFYRVGLNPNRNLTWLDLNQDLIWTRLDMDLFRPAPHVVNELNFELGFHFGYLCKQVKPGRLFNSA